MTKELKLAASMAVIAALAGCASDSGVVPMGQDSYMVSRQAATGFSGMGNLKAESFQEANRYCVEQGKNFQLVHTSETQPPYILGNYPKVEIQFMCLSSGDPQLARPKLKKDPDAVIQIQQ